MKIVCISIKSDSPHSPEKACGLYHPKRNLMGKTGLTHLVHLLLFCQLLGINLSLMCSALLCWYFCFGKWRSPRRIEAHLKSTFVGFACKSRWIWNGSSSDVGCHSSHVGKKKTRFCGLPHENNCTEIVALILLSSAGLCYSYGWRLLYKGEWWTRVIPLRTQWEIFLFSLYRRVESIASLKLGRQK